MAVMVALAAGIGGLLWHDTRLGKVNEQLRLTVIEAEANAQEARSQKSRAEAHERLLRRQLAGHQVFGAQQAVTARDFERAFRLIDSAGPELGTPANREFAWSYLRQKIRDRVEILERTSRSRSAGSPRAPMAARSLPVTIVGRSGCGTWRPGRAARWYPKNVMIFNTCCSARTDAISPPRPVDPGEIFVWDAVSGHLRARSLGSDHKAVSALLFSKDGGRLAALGPNPAAAGSPFECWDVRAATGKSFSIWSPDDDSTTVAD